MPMKKIPTPKALAARDGDVVLLVGTMKGLFLFRSTATRRRWDVAGPYFPGTTVYAAALDTRGGRRRLWAAVGGRRPYCFGVAGVHRSSPVVEVISLKKNILLLLIGGFF